MVERSPAPVCAIAKPDVKASATSGSSSRAHRRAGNEAVGNSTSWMTAARGRRATIVDEDEILLQLAVVFAQPMDLSYKSGFLRNSATWSTGPQ
ncbi:MAG: hypothetical protein ACHP7M_07405 [Burkholderiales bacterium]|jgi:hypothetical protein